MIQRCVLLAGVTTVLAFAPASLAFASFHFMQIEQVTGGICGDQTAQAVQLRMRFGGQNLVSGNRLVVHDAAGGNPVILITFPEHVSNGGAGSRILATTPEYAAASDVTPDFLLENTIPESYLAAGKLTFQTAGDTVYWSLAWGGSDYTGTNTGSTTNDDDGDFSPPFPGALPSSANLALQFTGAASDASTTNAADYGLSASPAIFTNNDGGSGGVTDCVFYDGFEVGTPGS